MPQGQTILLTICVSMMTVKRGRGKENTNILQTSYVKGVVPVLPFVSTSATVGDGPNSWLQLRKLFSVLFRRRL